tara:strand:+ start:4204 stop:4506 length:303 start_codon:yes stop_codon:yes gene_type:complete
MLLVSCYQPIPDGEYRLVTINGEKEYRKHFLTFKGQEFGSFTIQEGLKIDHGKKIIQYESDNIFKFKRKDIVYRWKYILSNDTLRVESQNSNMNITLLKN